MGLDMTYIAGEDKLSFRLPPNEIDILEYLKEKGFEREIEIIFGASDFGEESNVQRSLLLESVNHLLKTINNNTDILPITYSAKREIPRRSGKYSTGGWAISGLKINNEMYDLEYGLDKCELTKKWQDEDGKIHLGEPKDVRELSIIKLDPYSFSGDVIITKKRKPTKLIQYNIKDSGIKCGENFSS